MSSSSNRQKLSRTLERCLKEKDKFQSVTLKISEFGLVQMTRKRSGKTLLQQLTNVCATCSGCGFLKSVPTMSFQILSAIKEEIRSKALTETLTLTVSLKVFDYLIHQEYQSILQLEKVLNCKIMVESSEKFDDSQHTIKKM